MAVQLYTKGALSARTLISDGKYDDKSPWSFSAEDGNALLGDAGDDWTNFGKFHLGEDTSAAANTKGRFKYPHGKDGKVYGGALRAIRSRASQQDEKAIYDKAGELLDLIKTKEGTDGRQALRAQSFPAYDPDGDGDNDAQEAHGSGVAAGHLLDTAAGALSGAPGDSTTQAISRTLAAKGPRRGARAEALPDYDPDGDGDNDAEEALTHVRAAGTLLDYADDSLTGSPTDPETKASERSCGACASATRARRTRALSCRSRRRPANRCCACTPSPAATPSRWTCSASWAAISGATAGSPRSNLRKSFARSRQKPLGSRCG